MFDTKKKLAEVGSTLWSLNQTLPELRASCELLAKATEKQDERLRSLESEIHALRADIKVSSAESKTAAVREASNVASSVIGNANKEIFDRLSELQDRVRLLLDADYPIRSEVGKNPVGITRKVDTSAD